MFLFVLVSVFTVAVVLQSALAEKSCAADAKEMKETSAGTQSFSDAVKAEKGASSFSQQQLSGGSAAARAPFTEVKVAKATGDNAYTVAEIFEKNKDLDGKTVRVRGKVVRYNPAIMGKNWIHIQDGTGDPMKNTHDLVATSTQTATVGEVITVEGKLAANKDFGAGYVYTAIVEDAKVTK